MAGAIAGSAARAEQSATQLFTTGRLAFESGDFPAALTAFDAAVRAGLSGPAVHFNIGVAAFRAGEYERAETAFVHVAQTPSMAALAHYNLGLVALRRNDREVARRWFARAGREAIDEKLRALAATQIALLDEPTSRDWFGFAALGAGYDSNVALVSAADVLGISGVDDGFVDAQFAIGGPLAQPWQFDASLAHLDYIDLDEFDQLALQGGARYRLSTGEWSNDFIAQLGYQVLDGTGFENRRTVAIQASRDIRPRWRMRARYRFNDIDGMNRFEGVTGRSHEAGVRFKRTGQPWDVEIEYRFDSSDTHDRNLAATRHRLGFDVSRQLSADWMVALDAAVRDSRYDMSANGTEFLTELAVAFTRTLSARWRLIVRYDYTHNDADRAGFDYDRNRLTAIVEATL